MRILVGAGAAIIGAVKLGQLYMSNEPFERKTAWYWVGLIVLGLLLVGAEVALIAMD